MTKAKKDAASENHPDHKSDVSRIRRVRGQIDGIEKMVLDRRYCPDIIGQIKAAKAALGALEVRILERHLGHCVRDAMTGTNDKTRDEKISELVKLFSRG